MNLSGNAVSKVWTDGRYHWKEQPKHLCDNEWYALNLLRDTGFVPDATRVNHETIQMESITNEPITNPDLFRTNCEVFLAVIADKRLRHGDLTPPHVFVVKNSPVVIDWGESRYGDDPRPDKRREGDRHWMVETVEALIAIQRASTPYVECHK
jgi:RIO-like serine/threonine protein kinase